MSDVKLILKLREGRDCQKLTNPWFVEFLSKKLPYFVLDGDTDDVEAFFKEILPQLMKSDDALILFREHTRLRNLFLNEYTNEYTSSDPDDQQSDQDDIDENDDELYQSLVSNPFETPLSSLMSLYEKNDERVRYHNTFDRMMNRTLQTKKYKISTIDFKNFFPLSQFREWIFRSLVDDILDNPVLGKNHLRCRPYDQISIQLEKVRARIVSLSSKIVSLKSVGSMRVSTSLNIAFLRLWLSYSWWMTKMSRNGLDHCKIILAHFCYATVHLLKEHRIAWQRFSDDEKEIYREMKEYFVHEYEVFKIQNNRALYWISNIMIADFYLKDKIFDLLIHHVSKFVDECPGMNLQLKYESESEENVNNIFI